ncbi:MAG: hypothetical protein QM805_04240 [Pseudomonas sp.]
MGLLITLALLALLLTMRTQGRFEGYTKAVLNLVNVGDGLPPKSDVKYHGMIVGEVVDVVPAIGGQHFNEVNINIYSRHAPGIPAHVTARVIPANVFAVSAVELVGGDDGGPTVNQVFQDNGKPVPIAENTELPTVLFQTTLTKLRDALVALGRGREDRSIGVIEAVQVATQNRRPALMTAGAQLDRLLKNLNGVMADDPEQTDTTVAALVNATEGLKQTAPELVDALHKAIRPMQVFVEQKQQLATLLSTGLNTVGTMQTAMANNNDKLVKITGNLTPALGSIAMQADNFVPAAFQETQHRVQQVLRRRLDTPSWTPPACASTWR